MTLQANLSNRLPLSELKQMDLGPANRKTSTYTQDGAHVLALREIGTHDTSVREVYDGK